METNNKPTELKNQEKQAKKDEVQVTISLDCEKKLQNLLEKIGQDFDMARVTRKHLLAHIIDEAHSSIDDADIQTIRKNAITDFDLLDQEYREAKKTGVISAELKEYLWKSRYLAQSPKKAKKSGQTKYSNAISNTEESA